MSGQFLRATGQASPIQAPKLPPDGLPDKNAARRKKAFPQSPQILAKIGALQRLHGNMCNWWWRETDVSLFGTAIGDSFLFRQVFNTASYFYELEARRDGKQRGQPPRYPRNKPFNRLTWQQAMEIHERVRGRNLQGLHVAPLTWAEELSGSLSGKQFLLNVDLKNFRDDALHSQFKKVLGLLRKETGIKEPDESPRANRILNDGRSFRPIEALDVFRLSEDKVLRRHYSDQLDDARDDLKMSTDL